MRDPFDMLRTGDVEGLRALLAADPSLARSRNGSGTSLLAVAHYSGHAEAAGLILPHCGELAPADAIIAGDEAALERALAGGWDANDYAPDGFTPLALAAFFGRRAMFERLLPLTSNLDARATNAQRVTALHAATARRQAGMVESLLRAGAQPDLPQAGGFTALHAAAAQGDTAIVAMLLLFGADPARRNDAGEDAADQARAGGHDWLAALLATPVSGSGRT